MAIKKQCSRCGYRTEEHLQKSEVRRCLICDNPMTEVLEFVNPRSVRVRRTKLRGKS